MFEDETSPPKVAKVLLDKCDVLLIYQHVINTYLKHDDWEARKKKVAKLLEELLVQ